MDTQAMAEMRTLRYLIAEPFARLSLLFGRIAEAIEPAVDPKLDINDMIRDIEPHDTPFARAMK